MAAPLRAAGAWRVLRAKDPRPPLVTILSWPLAASWPGPLSGGRRDLFPTAPRRLAGTYKGPRPTERGIVACTALSKMNSFVSPTHLIL